MTRRRWTMGPVPQRRDVSVAPLLVTLRSALGLPPHELAPGERAASRGRHLPPLVEGVDAGARIACSLVGLSLFSLEASPKLRNLLGEAKRMLLALAMERTAGNISHVGAMLGICRRIARDILTRLSPL